LGAGTLDLESLSGDGDLNRVLFFTVVLLVMCFAIFQNALVCRDDVTVASHSKAPCPLRRGDAVNLNGIDCHCRLHFTKLG
jgi:hypothetical protein